ncbi:hypothetical protein KIN20_023948 [Parelaphostrongylus tenuis]|uniref:SCP domain-containing protein n=1 Tax=Parelaphostrongylus tenuis TaxID=148309 RepID=A0AAD5NCI9_PARTN|nr:hypothetical protein KIN20_023948 [Parelaphostrongylus tenuis]
MQAIANFIFELRGNGIPSNMILTPQVFNRRSRTVTRVSKVCTILDSVCSLISFGLQRTSPLQVLWGSNRFVGCATQLCGSFYFTSCMYRNPVNVVGQSIYNIGAVCSACPTGPNNCNLAIGLCSY